MSIGPRKPIVKEPIERTLLKKIQADEFFSSNPELLERLRHVLDSGCAHWQEVGSDPGNEAFINAVILFIDAHEDIAEMVHSHLETIADADDVNWMDSHGPTAVRTLAIWVVEQYIDES